MTTRPACRQTARRAPRLLAAAATALFAAAGTAAVSAAPAAAATPTFTQQTIPQASGFVPGGPSTTTACPTATLCYTVETVVSGSGYTPTPEIWTDTSGTWSGPVALPGGAYPTNGVAGADQADVYGIWCASATSCVAVGDVQGPSTNSAAVSGFMQTAAYWTLTGSTWSSAVELPVGSELGLNSAVDIWCSSVTDCAVAGMGINGPDYASYGPNPPQNLLAWSLSGTTWTNTADLVNGDTTVSATVDAMSCTTTSSCTAVGVGQAVTAGSSPSNDGTVWQMSGGTWAVVNQTAGEEFRSVSCTTVCYVGGYQVSNDAPQIWQLSGATLAAATVPGTFSTVDAINCQSSTACTAVGSPLGGDSPNVSAWQLASGTWTTLTIPAASESGMSGGTVNATLDTLTCPSSTTCVAGGFITVGSPGTTGYNSQPIAYAVSFPSTGFGSLPGGTGTAPPAPATAAASGGTVAYTTGSTYTATPATATPPAGSTGYGSPLPPIDAPWWTVSTSETGAANVSYTWQMAMTTAVAGLTSITFALPDGTAGSPSVAQCYGIDCAGATVAMGTGSSADVATLTVASQTLGANVPVEVVLSGLTNTATAGVYSTVVTLYSGATADAQSPSNTVAFGSSTTQVNVAVPDSATFTDSAPDIYVTPIPGSGVAYAACGTGATASGDPATATGSAPCPVDLSVSTNSGSGFTISAAASALKTGSGYTLAEGSAAGSSAYAEDTFAAEAAVTAGSATTTTPWGSSTWVGYSASPVQIASASAATGTNTVTVAVTNAAEVDFAQAAGDYHGTLTYSLTPGY